MLTELSLTNFKSWQQISKMRLAPITGLFGSNSSGKTSLLQLLLMLKQTVESPDRAQVLNFGDDRSPTNLGSFRDVVYKHQKPGAMDLSLSWKLPKSLSITDPEARKAILFEGDALGFEAHIAENGAGRLVVDRMSYAFSEHRFTMRRKREGEAKFELEEESGHFEFLRTQGRPWDLPAPVKFYGFPDQVKAYFQTPASWPICNSPWRSFSPKCTTLDRSANTRSASTRGLGRSRRIWDDAASGSWTHYSPRANVAN